MHGVRRGKAMDVAEPSAEHVTYSESYHYDRVAAAYPPALHLDALTLLMKSYTLPPDMNSKTMQRLGFRVHAPMN